MTIIERLTIAMGNKGFRYNGVTGEGHMFEGMGNGKLVSIAEPAGETDDPEAIVLALVIEALAKVDNDG